MELSLSGFTPPMSFFRGIHTITELKTARKSQEKKNKNTVWESRQCKLPETTQDGLALFKTMMRSQLSKLFRDNSSNVGISELFDEKLLRILITNIYRHKKELQKL